MNKQSQLLQNSLPLIAAGLGDKLGVRVTVSGDQARTNGHEINIPAFNIQSKEQKDAVLGFMAHEAAHIKYDTFKAKRMFQSNKFKFNIFNIIEDMRIEHCIINDMVGTKKWINQIWINRQQNGRSPIDDSANEASTACEFLLFHCRVFYREQSHLKPYLEAANDVFTKKFGLKLYWEIINLLDTEMPNVLKSDANSAALLAEKVYNAFLNHQPEDDSQNNTGNSQDCSDETTEQDDQTSSSGSGQSNSPSSDEIITTIQAVIKSQENYDDMAELTKEMETLASISSLSTVAMPVSHTVTAINDDDHINNKVNKTSNQLTVKLQSIVESEMRVKCKTKNSGLKLKSQLLHRTATNDSRVFSHKAKKQQIDTIVELCLDNSGSMGHFQLLNTAKEAQLALAKALTRINGVSVTASAFPCSTYSRRVLNLLDEGESVKQLAKRYHSVTGTGASTPTASAMMHCLRKVLSSTKSNKVIMIITDGFPNDNEKEALIDLVKKAEISGITVIGIAIGPIADNKHLFLQYFKHSLFIQDINELKIELFKIAKKILVNK
ncbi:vWA domain-containing protein [Vibrio cholerae]